MKKEFCRICGKEKTVKKMLDVFDEKTGKQEFKMECPDLNNDCKHGHDFVYRDKKELKWFTLSAQPSLRCKKCGMLEYSYSDLI